MTNVTDVIARDAFDRISAGRSAFRIDDLLELRRLLEKHKKDQRGRRCKYNYAAYDRITLPHRSRPEKVRLLDIYRLLPDCVRIQRGIYMARAAKGCILFT
jgi:hypothetical protein